MNRVAIVQARMSSTRLPGKVLAEVSGQPLLWRVVQRVQAAKRVESVGVATSDRSSDDAIADFCAAKGIACWRGSEDDVLDRFYRAAQAFRAESVVRITGDCPLIDPAVIDLVVDKFESGEYDYVSNGVQRTYPDGLDCEVFSFNALERAWREAEWVSEREHVTPYLYKHPERFRIGHVLHCQDLSLIRWTVDEPRDLEFVRRVFSHFGEQPFGMNDILHWVSQQPEIAGINAGIETNAGYRKSLENDLRVIKRTDP